ncbi:hypothetical protein PHYSODRAFT_324122 [Phytophthora sojae]|uniref:Uncharacterized protein n=1 Tax=Phytophthora sojae (strain P6497) TaxID=1094619 RepID=G4YR83_PHYSP|nr:hypothetical protein PHYSODRAFT_324122 [Phytophthora sojae]EGZ22817.1 hypothetical protein PHYSODRAFT_324122 [Phytophthora sojae]|eukprot:XP_009518105.1 hypothetical protein PHYSODRAFT_324122 [Phytophthora sojae]
MHSQLRCCILSTNRSVLQLQQRSMSFKVRVGPIQSPKVPIAERQRVLQTWGISSSETLEKLRVATPGLSYVSVASPALFAEVAQAQGSSSDQLVAVARVSSDAHDLLERVEVLVRGSNRLLIGFDPRPPRGWPVQEPTEPGKHLLTEIFVREGSELRNVSAFGSGSLVVTGNANDRPYGKLKVAAFRGSRVFVTQEQGFRVGRMSLFAGGRSQLYLSTSEVVARDRIRAAASGGRWGGSSIIVQTSKLSTPSFGAAVAGSGSIRVASGSDEGDCRCGTQSLVIAGSGSIDTGDITSKSARVGIIGSGSATLQTTERLAVGTLGTSARVNYLEPGPERVRGSTSSLRALTAAAKAQHDEERAAIAAATTTPTRECAFEGNGSNINRWWWAPWGTFHPHRFHRRQMKGGKRWRDDYAY